MRAVLVILGVFIIGSSLHPIPHTCKCNCSVEVSYYKKGKLLHRHQSIWSGVYGSGIEQIPLEFEGKIYRPDSLIFKSSNLTPSRITIGPPKRKRDE